MSSRVLKTFSSGEFHYVFGEVYAPDIVDTDGESMSAADIQKMAHDFIASGRVSALDIDHSHELCGATVVESFIARAGDPDFAEGSWVLGIRMPDGELWERVQSGELNSFSVDALVTKVASARKLPKLTSACGTTAEQSDLSTLPPHTHAFFIEFDEQGRVSIGRTSKVLGHVHAIEGTVTTEKADGHSHRFFVEQTV